MQALGLLAAIAYVFPISLGMFLIIKATVGLRIVPEVEDSGIDAVYHGMESYPEFTSSDAPALGLDTFGAELAGAD